jgi:hypothetical protein
MCSGLPLMTQLGRRVRGAAFQVCYSNTSSAMESMLGGFRCVQDHREVQRFELTLAFLARDGFVAHRGLPGHDGHEDSSLPEVLKPYGIS